MSTRRMRENIDPETGDPRTGPAPYRAIGTDAQVTPAFRAIGGSGGSSSLLDRRSGGLFAKGGIKSNWRADGGLNTQLGGSAKEIASQVEGTGMKAATASVVDKLKTMQSDLDGYLTGEGPNMVLAGSEEDESFSNTGGRSSFQSGIDPLQFRGIDESEFTLKGTRLAAEGGQVRSFAGQLDDYVFNGSMSDKDRQQVMRVMNRKYGARGVL